MKSKRGCGSLPWLVAAATLLTLRPGLLRAAESELVTKSVTMTAGESYVIDKVSPDATPGIKVVKNPHALVIHSEMPGKIMLVGAEAGEWNLSVTMADGQPVTYHITVNKIAAMNDIDHPAMSPPAISGSGRKVGSAAPVVAKLDPGAGPVDTSAATASASDASSPGSPSPAKDGSEIVSISSHAAPLGPSTSVASAPMAPVVVKPISDDSSSSLPSVPAPSVASQTAQAAVAHEKFRTDPSIALSGGDYSSDAVSGGTHYLPDDVVSMQTGSSIIIDFPKRLRRVSMADTTIADIQVINPFQVNIIGHKPGFTTLAVWNQQGHYDERSVRIDPNGKQQVMLNTMVAELNRTNIENQGTNLSGALTKYGVSMVGLPGSVATPYSASTNITSTGPFGNTTGAVLPFGGSVIPMLLSQGLTYGLAAGNSNFQIQSFFQYLEQHDMAKILAQPHLLANSGEEAKFLSGGEIPIVITQALNTSIVFKQFGTSVEFVPTVVGRDDVELLVKPEVSQPDYSHGVQLFGFTVPAFITRRAETMVRMRDNQTLIIAGLILHDKRSIIKKVPYMGDIPYLGGLFRNTSYYNTETDLVMAVTPQIVRPLPAGASVYNPTAVPEMTEQQIKTRDLSQPDAARPRF
ncbi:MAG: pilus assembly protein N-terminal domain-containing protein [Candidatus Binatus sp.]|uniref:type II and III secretion system protein family protein n=1 Tax=Candidatus Binatus sp. TaxID=2811406 RepID=UPI00271EE0AF|nr:pilus assembly protein N-terminal domain-containing protein [Candidatus Binatus sp.]MDO8431817.1 pilus assembly protein N-terminal domain-containing protein [Candidatus Binatus sp.]